MKNVHILTTILFLGIKSLTFSQDIKAYQNYDFVAGQKIIFEDNFKDDKDGEFASHWDITNGQAVLNKMDNDLVMKVTDGNAGTVLPLMKEKNYLPKEFTLEYDYYQTAGAYGLKVWFQNIDNAECITMQASRGESTLTFYVDDDQRTLSGNTHEELVGENFDNKWHHVAFIFKNGMMKLYIDQFRVVNVPRSTSVPTKVFFGGIGNQENPLIFKNVKIAEGGDMNTIGQAFTDGKYISHGIRFDVNKATIKPESMGEINAIAKILKDNASLKMEVGGYTDSDGDDAANLKLSQARADAVKTQLTILGIEANRLTTKGYGETKPIGDNATFEGKANNRRVEFVKI